MYAVLLLSKPTECSTPRATPKINYGLCMIVMYQFRFILGKNCTILVNDGDKGRGYACVGAEAMINPCALLSILV